MIKTSTLVRALCLSIVFLLAFSFCAFAAESNLTLRGFIDEGIGDNFILKDAYEIIARTSSRIASYSWNHFAQPLQAIVGLGAAIYIALYTLKNIGSFSQQDVAAYLSNEKTGVIPLAVKLTIIIWLLNNQAFVYKYLVGLAITTCIEVGSLIGPNSGIGSFSSPESLEALFRFVINQIIGFNDAIYHIVATGRLLLHLASMPDDFYLKLFCFGGALWIYGWLIILGVSFYMLDVLLRLGLGCIMLPFAIACGISKLTIDYTRKTWNLFVNVGFNFIMLGILTEFTYTMIGKCVGLNIPENKVLNVADAVLINKNLDFGVFVITALCSMIAYQLFLQIEQVAEKVSGASVDGKVGREVGAKLSKLTKRVGGAPIREVGKFTGAAAQLAGKQIKFSVNNLRHKISNSIKRSSPYRAVSRSWVGRSYRATKKILRWDER